MEFMRKMLDADVVINKSWNNLAEFNLLSPVAIGNF
jgi:hypothetical protein